MPTDTAVADKTATTQQVFEHHLQAFALGLDALVSDFTEQSVIQLPDKTLRGLTAIRQFYSDFLNSIQPGFWESFHIKRQAVEGDTAYLVWDAKPFVSMATDTLYISNGKIQVQTFTPFADSSNACR